MDYRRDEMRRLIDRLERDHKLTKEEWIAIITEGADREFCVKEQECLRRFIMEKKSISEA